VHSKAMVVDDEYVVIGSANINDRSMMGDRDSEVAVLIHGSSFAKKVRMDLWKEHFDLLNCGTDFPLIKSLDDPVSDECFKLWKSTGKANAEILRRVFGVVPCNEVKSRTEFIERINQKRDKPPVNISDITVVGNMKKLVGRVVQFQLEFLSYEDDLYDPMPTTASLCPREVFS